MAELIKLIVRIHDRSQQRLAELRRLLVRHKSRAGSGVVSPIVANVAIRRWHVQDPGNAGVESVKRSFGWETCMTWYTFLDS